jgi:hypothetical protein
VCVCERLYFDLDVGLMEPFRIESFRIDFLAKPESFRMESFRRNLSENIFI